MVEKLEKIKSNIYDLINKKYLSNYNITAIDLENLYKVIQELLEDDISDIISELSWITSTVDDAVTICRCNKIVNIIGGNNGKERE